MCDETIAYRRGALVAAAEGFLGGLEVETRWPRRSGRLARTCPGCASESLAAEALCWLSRSQAVAKWQVSVAAALGSGRRAAETRIASHVTYEKFIVMAVMA